MGVLDLRKQSTLLTVSALTSVTVGAGTGQVYKVTCTDLEKKVLPSPDSGATFQGMAKIVDSSGNVGCFIMVGGNPRATSSGGFNAREVWLAPVSSAFIQAEYGTEQAADLDDITLPEVGHKIVFDTITGATPQTANSITPSGFSAGCVSATLRGHRQDDSEDIAKLSQRIDVLSDLDVSALLGDDQSIFTGLIPSWTSGLNVNLSAGTGRYKGILFSSGSGSASSITEKTLSRIYTDTLGVFGVQYENSDLGILDADYNPSGGSPIPSAASAPWTLTGSLSVNSASNGIYTMTVAATQGFWSRLSVAGPSASGSVFEEIMQYVSGTGFKIKIDHGAGANQDSIGIENGYIDIASTGQRFSFDTTIPFTIRIALQNAVCNVYINGSLVLSSAYASAGATNQFSFGWLTSSTGSVRIARIRTRAGLVLAPSFPALAGVALGTCVTMTAAHSAPVGLLGKQTDIKLGQRIEGKIATITDKDNIAVNKKTIYISGNYTQQIDDEILICNSSVDFTITGLTQKDSFSRPIEIINLGSGSVTYDPSGSELIDTYSSLLISPNRTVRLLPIGGRYILLADYQLNQSAANYLANFPCYGLVNFDGTTAANLSGTYSQSGFTVTVSVTNHGHKAGHRFYNDITSGAGVDGTYIVTSVIDANNFTYTAGTSLTTSGNCSLLRRAIRASGNVASVSYLNSNGLCSINMINSMPDVSYSQLAFVSGQATSLVVYGVNDTYAKGANTFVINSINSLFAGANSSEVTVLVFR